LKNEFDLLLFSALLSPVFHMLEAGGALAGGHQPLREAAALLLSQEQLINTIVFWLLQRKSLVVPGNLIGLINFLKGGFFVCTLFNIASFAVHKIPL
jgi:hypothetical protein